MKIFLYFHILIKYNHLQSKLFLFFHYFLLLFFHIQLNHNSIHLFQFCILLHKHYRLFFFQQEENHYLNNIKNL